MSDTDEAQDTLDCIGLLCPEPLFQTREAMDGLERGDVLEVLADDPAAEEDLTRFAKRAGHEIVVDRGRRRPQALPDPQRRDRRVDHHERREDDPVRADEQRSRAAVLAARARAGRQGDGPEPGRSTTWAWVC